MPTLFSRKYNNSIIWGLCAALAIAVGVIIYMFSTDKKIASHSLSGHVLPPNEPPPGTKLSSGMPALVLFYADWCGHSKNMLPAWESVKRVLRESGQIEAIDFEQGRDKEEVETAMKTLPNLRGFPDIRYFPTGYPGPGSIQYSGDRSEESLLKFAYTQGKSS